MQKSYQSVFKFGNKVEWWKKANVWIPATARSCDNVKLGSKDWIKPNRRIQVPFQYKNIHIYKYKINIKNNEENRIAFKIYYLLCELFSPNESPFVIFRNPFKGPVYIRFLKKKDFEKFEEGFEILLETEKKN